MAQMAFKNKAEENLWPYQDKSDSFPLNSIHVFQGKEVGII